MCKFCSSHKKLSILLLSLISHLGLPLLYNSIICFLKSSLYVFFLVPYSVTSFYFIILFINLTVLFLTIHFSVIYPFRNCVLKKLIREHNLFDLVFYKFRYVSITYKLKWNGGNGLNEKGKVKNILYD